MRPVGPIYRVHRLGQYVVTRYVNSLCIDKGFFFNHQLTTNNPHVVSGKVAKTTTEISAVTTELEPSRKVFPVHLPSIHCA
jgi:hypothetical protein